VGNTLFGLVRLGVEGVGYVWRRGVFHMLVVGVISRGRAAEAVWATLLDSRPPCVHKGVGTRFADADGALVADH